MIFVSHLLPLLIRKQKTGTLKNNGISRIWKNWAGKRSGWDLPVLKSPKRSASRETKQAGSSKAGFDQSAPKPSVWQLARGWPRAAASRKAQDRKLREGGWRVVKKFVSVLLWRSILLAIRSTISLHIALFVQKTSSSQKDVSNYAWCINIQIS